MFTYKPGRILSVPDREPRRQAAPPSGRGSSDSPAITSQASDVFLPSFMVGGAERCSRYSIPITGATYARMLGLWVPRHAQEHR